MTRSRINGNFIDKTFTIVANILLRIIPTTSGEKEDVWSKLIKQPISMWVTIINTRKS